jgi:hypothetical protein
MKIEPKKKKKNFFFEKKLIHEKFAGRQQY